MCGIFFIVYNEEKKPKLFFAYFIHVCIQTDAVCFLASCNDTIILGGRDPPRATTLHRSEVMTPQFSGRGDGVPPW